MSQDVLLSNAHVRGVLRALKLPLPQPLVRAVESADAVLQGKVVHVSAIGRAPVDALLTRELERAGAQVVTASEGSLHALVCDVSSAETVDALGALFRALEPLVKQVARSGRVVLVSRAGGESSPEGAAVQQGAEGFVRSLAKELGRIGATVNLIRAEPDAIGRVGAVLRFLLSPRAAFITGQPWTVTAHASHNTAASLEGRVALVTGSARGIGASTARSLAREGARVVVLDRAEDEAAARALAQEIGGKHLACDVAAIEAPAKIASFLREMGGVDVVVHNAGVTRDRTFARMDAARWNQCIEVNLGAVLRVHGALAGVLRDEGRVIALSSIAGIAGNVGQTNYAASKAALAGWVRALAPTVAARGITVNAMAPGFIETRMTAAIPWMIRQAARRLSALNQGGQPEDVAELAAFLASPGSHGVTGQVLRVCGGALVGA